jgi:hypothetical protein
MDAVSSVPPILSSSLYPHRAPPASCDTGRAAAGVAGSFKNGVTSKHPSLPGTQMLIFGCRWRNASGR